jgi:predicted DsbA family dithiol-disulfide isomerase
VLLAAAQAAGLSAEGAERVIGGDAFTQEVREALHFWQQAGISAVPSVIINRRHLIQGGQPPEAFLQALTQISDADGA